MHSSYLLSGISKQVSSLDFLFAVAGNFPYYAGNVPYYADIMPYAFQPLLC